MAVRQQSERGQALFDLLRQLALGLSTYRLFPESLDQPGYVAALDRIERAAGRALTLGARHAEIRQGRFRDGDGDVLSDEHVDRLAAACFERGVEHLSVREVPRRDELGRLFAALSITPEEAAAQGGLPTILQRASVFSLRLGDVALEGDEHADHSLEELTAEQLDVWRQVLDPERYAANLLIEGLGRDEATAAHEVYRRFETVRAVLPVALTADPTFVQNLVQVVEGLPGAVRREFTAHAITRNRAGDELAGEYLSAMTDTQLASSLVDLQEAGGLAAREAASELVDEVGRQTGIVDVTVAFLEARGLLEQAGGDDEGSLVSALSSVEAGAARDSLARDTAADLFASRLLEATDHDIVALRAAYPDTPDELRRAALDAFRDYLRNEQEDERLSRALEVWSDHLEQAVTAQDDATVDQLLGLMEATHDEMPGEGQRQLVDLARGRILGAEMLSTLAERARHDTETPMVVATLRRFGAAAEEALLDLLATEGNRGTRAVLVSMLTELAGDDLTPVVARLTDDRWYVVRNCVTILGRLPERAGFPHLASLVDHPHAHVRRELVRALLSSGGSDAVPHLERLADDRDADVRHAAITGLGSLVSDPAARALGRVVELADAQDDRRRALDELSRHAAPEATEVLAQLASRSHEPRLPRALRKHAKKGLSRRGSRP